MMSRGFQMRLTRRILKLPAALNLVAARGSTRHIIRVTVIGGGCVALQRGRVSWGGSLIHPWDLPHLPAGARVLTTLPA